MRLYMAEEGMFAKGRDSVKTIRAMEVLRDHLLRHGPATAKDLEDILALSRAETYEFIRKASRRGVIRPVAHVHTDSNHQPRAWDVDSPDGEWVWRRRERLIRGRFCTCPPAGARRSTSR